MEARVGKRPLIKWTGSKRKQASAIVDLFPKEIDTYYEPFVGGGSVMHELLNRIALGENKCKKIVCSDINKYLIDIWNYVKNEPKKLLEYYKNLYNKLFEASGMLTKDQHVLPENVKKAQVVYYEQRNRFNKMDNDNPEKSLLFFWLTRTCFNGLIRFNPKGEFNVPFHVAGGLGIRPDILEDIIDAWRSEFALVDIEFICDSYDNVIKNAKEGDVIYMDPPYEMSKGMYFSETFDKEHMYDVIRDMKLHSVPVLLSYDGKSGKTDRTAQVPEDLYIEHHYINSGHSSFKKLKSTSRGKENKDEVLDSLYICI